MAEGFTLRGYTVERRLGSGASGEVWRARASSSGAAVALKRIPTGDAERRERALSEGALLATLDHPNLVRLHAVIPTADAVVLVLDLADGGSLADLLAARGRLEAGEVITALAPVAAALASVHAAGYLHGDVSPGNVLFTADGVPMLADLGVARLIGAAGAAEATAGYVDPAVAAGAVPAPPSDVFMLGGVALHALTGEPPWPTVDPSATLALAAGGRPRDPSGRLEAANVPPAMAALVARALDVDPQRRGTAAELALELRHSARPVAVELQAGRARQRPDEPWTGPRHAARPTAGGGLAPEQRVAPGNAARPAFARPAEIRAAEPPTRMVGPRPRPVIPRPRRRRPSTRLLRSVGAGLLGAAVLGAVGLALFGSARADGAADQSRAPRQPRVELETGGSVDAGSTLEAPAPAASSTAAPTTRSATGPAAGPAAGSAAGSATGPDRWRRELEHLDARRAAAYARRDPGALSRVYASTSLAATDIAQLTRLVPAGCGLRGVRTRFAGVQVTPTGAQASLLVTATLPPSQLVCAGAVRATMPGAGPTRLRLELTRTPYGVRIAAQEIADG